LISSSVTNFRKYPKGAGISVGIKRRVFKELPFGISNAFASHGMKPIFANSVDERKSMKRICTAFVLLIIMASPMFGQKKEQERVGNAGRVMQEILNIPDDIPQSVIDKADCVVVLPSVLKFAFGLGGSYGRGVMTCRTGEDFKGPWGAPTMMALEGGSFGLQLGGQATDFVLLLMSPRSARSILDSKVKLGGDISAAAGPVGRNVSAETDVTLRAEILSYSRARGLFAGISLSGSTLRPDNAANKKLYGKNISARDVVLNNEVAAPAPAKLLLAELNKKSPTNKSNGQS
jgi:lipid-binding SYLF domain-containing protein